MDGFTSIKFDISQLYNSFLVIILIFLTQEQFSGHHSDISDPGTVLGFSAILLPQLGQVGPNKKKTKFLKVFHKKIAIFVALTRALYVIHCTMRLFNCKNGN